MASPLRNATFRNLFAARTIALVGNGLTTVALALVVVELAATSAAVALGTVLACKMVLYVSVGTFAGALARRFNRVGLMVTMDFARAACVVGLAFATHLGHVYAAMALLSAASAVFSPVYNATLPDVVPDPDEYARAVSLSRLVYDAESLAGGALAAALLTVVDVEVLFAINGACYLFSAGLVLLAKLPSREPVGVMERSATRGLRVYLSTQPLRTLLPIAVAVAACGAMVIVNSAPYARSTLGASESQVAVVLSVAGAGSLLGTLVLPRVVSVLRAELTMLLGCSLLAVFVALPAMAASVEVLCAGWFGVGLGWAFAETPMALVLQRFSDPDNRADVYAAHFSLTHACWLGTYPFTGWLATRVGMPSALLVTSAIALGSATFAAWMLFRSRAGRRLKVVWHAHEHTHERDHDHVHLLGSSHGSGREGHRHHHVHLIESGR